MYNKRIVITGGAGFLGSVVVRKMAEHGYQKCFVIRSNQYDLTTESAVRSMYEELKPDIVIHMAAVVGGIGINQLKPGTFYYKNLMMGTLLQEYGRINNISKFVNIGTICAYPKYTPVPFKETDLWVGYPEETNAPYGLAKKMLLVQAQAYRKEFNFNGIYLLPVNLYGPNDNFDPGSSHVIPAIIKKCVDAIRKKEKKIICWGTGEVTREFIYVDDAAEAIVLATEKYNGEEPINIGSGEEISIKALTEKIANLSGYDGTIEWDNSKPDGQPRRCLDTSKAKILFNFTSKISLDVGLKNTIKWYEDHK